MKNRFVILPKTLIVGIFLAFLSCAGFVGASQLRTRSILYYDELLDILPIKLLTDGCNAIQFNDSIRQIFTCIPISASTQYQGTLRGFLFYPLVKLDLLNSQTFVLFNTILFFLVTTIFYHLMLKLSGKKLLSLLFSLLMAIQPLIWTQFIFDLGPVSTQVLLRTLLLYSAWHDLTKSKVCGKYTLLLSGLLIWGKLDGIWFVTGLILGQLVTNGWKNYRHKFNGLVLSLLLGWIMSGIYSYLVSRKQNSANIDFNLHLKLFYQIPLDLINGISPVVVTTNTNNSRLLALPIVLLFFFAMIGPFTRNKSRLSNQYRFYILLKSLNLVLLVLYIITPRSTAPWHTVSLFPSSIALIATWIILAKGENESSQSKKSSHIRYKFAVAVIALGICTSGIASQRDFQALKNGQIKPLFSRDLALAFDQIPLDNPRNSAILFSSWGLYNSVEMDNTIKNFREYDLVIDGWLWFAGKLDDQKMEFFKGIIDNGPLASAKFFTFVEINPSNLGSSGNLSYYVEKANVLCKVSKMVIPIKQQVASLTVIKGIRCS